MTCGGSEAEEDRISRSRARETASALRGARARIAWCMVGTAVYQLGRAASSQPNTRSASKPGAHQIEAPAARLDEIAASRPWMWNSGIMFMQRSAGVSASEAPMWRAEAATLRCSSGTILGREVVPEVCRISATSSGPAAAVSGVPPAVPSARRANRPAGPAGSKDRRSTARPCRPAASSAGPS